MDRRSFLKALIGVTALGSGLGAAVLLWRRPGTWRELPLGLPAALRELSDPGFTEAAAQFELAPLAAELRALGVVTDEGIALDVLAAAMAGDELVVYHGYHFAETELKLYALARLVE